jgi:uncharacterized membrane protein
VVTYRRFCGTLGRESASSSMASTITPRHESAFLGQTDEFRLLIKRNCSISPAGLLRVFALLALATLGIGAGLAAAGAWLVMPFAGLEVLEGDANFDSRVQLRGASGTLEVGRRLDARARIDFAAELTRRLRI